MGARGAVGQWGDGRPLRPRGRRDHRHRPAQRRRATIDALTQIHGLDAFVQTRTVRTRSGGFTTTSPSPKTLIFELLGPRHGRKALRQGLRHRPAERGIRLIKGGDAAPMPDWLLAELEVEERVGPCAEASDPKYFPFEKGTAYGLGALERILGRLALAEPGNRNNTLNKSAFGAAQLVAGGELDEEHAQEALYEMALKIGQGEHEAKATILSGWEAGAQEPRQAPERIESVTDTPNGHSEGEIAEPLMNPRPSPGSTGTSWRQIPHSSPGRCSPRTPTCWCTGPRKRPSP